MKNIKRRIAIFLVAILGFLELFSPMLFTVYANSMNSKNAKVVIEEGEKKENGSHNKDKLEESEELEEKENEDSEGEVDEVIDTNLDEKGVENFDKNQEVIPMPLLAPEQNDEVVEFENEDIVAILKDNYKTLTPIEEGTYKYKKSEIEKITKIETNSNMKLNWGNLDNKSILEFNKLPNLEILILKEDSNFNNKIKDLSGLNLPNLKEFSYISNSDMDISFLNNSPNLESLTLNSNDENFNSLIELTKDINKVENLKTLYLEGPKSPYFPTDKIIKFKNLEALSLRGVMDYEEELEFKDFENINTLVNLKYLDLEDMTKTKSSEKYSKLTDLNLEHLIAVRENLKNLDFLEHMNIKSLKKLDLGENSLYDLTKLGEIPDMDIISPIMNIQNQKLIIRSYESYDEVIEIDNMFRDHNGEKIRPEVDNMTGNPGGFGYDYQKKIFVITKEKLNTGSVFATLDYEKDNVTYQGQLEIQFDFLNMPVTFNANGGVFFDNEPIKEITVEKGALLDEETLEIPKKEEYIFEGWYQDIEGKIPFYFEIQIKKPTILYAKWKKEFVDIIFETNGGNAVDSQKIKNGEKAKEPENPTKDGYEFVGWYENEDLTGSEFDFNTEITSDKTLYAKWEKADTSEIIEVIFDANGGKVEGQDKITKHYKDNEKVLEPETPTRKGYEFKYWSTDKSGNNKYVFGQSEDKDLILYAQWEKESSGGNGGGHKPKPDKDKDKEVIRPQIENTIYHKAYIKGYEDNTVRPQGNLTREEAAMIIYRILDVESSNTKNYYSDVENTRWSKEAINYLSSKDIIEGYPDGKFRPEEKITRAEVTALITRLEKKTNKSENKFSDINNHWAKDYILISVANNWVVGYPEGDFRPDNNITRAEFVTMVNRMLGRKVDEDHIQNDIKKFKDLDKNEWYYTDIVEAANSHNLKEKRLKDNFEEWTSVVNINI